MNYNIDSLSEPVAAVIAAPYSQRFIDDLRRQASSAPWPRSKLYPLQANFLEANRIAHVAQVSGNLEALDAAILARCQAEGRLDEELDQIADMALSLLSIAVDRRPDSLANILSALPPSPDIVELADAVAKLQAKEAQRWVH